MSIRTDRSEPKVKAERPQAPKEAKTVEAKASAKVESKAPAAVKDGFDASASKSAATLSAKAAVEAVSAVKNAGLVTSRGLSDAEKAELQKVFGNSLDLTKVEVAQQPPWMEKMSQSRAFVVGNTIYMPKADYDRLQAIKDKPGPLQGAEQDTRSLLVHESTHVWQYQKGGMDYLPEALWAQHFGEGYNVGRGLEEGKSFGQMNPEQQAQLVQEAYKGGFFDTPGARLVSRQINDNKDLSGHETRVIGPNDPIPPGFTDYTDVMNGAVEQLRATPPPTPVPVPVPTPPVATPVPPVATPSPPVPPIATPVPGPVPTPTPEPVPTPGG